jgi:hypothetical protein
LSSEKNQRNSTKVTSRGRHQKRYSVIAITLRYIFELSHNASALRRKVITSLSYHSGLIFEIIIASYNNRFSLLGIVVDSYSYRSKVTKLLSLLITTTEFPPSGMNLTGHALLRARDMGEVILV